MIQVYFLINTLLYKYYLYYFILVYSLWRGPVRPKFTFFSYMLSYTVIKKKSVTCSAMEFVQMINV